jgi:hypothetical protein
MERVVFVIEETQQHLRCLLNPEGMEVRRRAGVQPRRLSGGALSGAGLADEPLLCTGGGATELRLDLLFDTDLDEAGGGSGDVRELTGPIWRLAENQWSGQGGVRLPVARLIWGKQWNVPGVVAAVAERLESFTAGGMPRRSWLRLRFLRVAEPEAGAAAAAPDPEDLVDLDFTADEAEAMPLHQVVGGDGDGDRLDVIAFRYYGDPGFWRVLAHGNDLDDPQDLEGGRLLRIPPAALVADRAGSGDGDLA